MRGAAGGAAIEIVIVVCAARAAVVHASTQTIETERRETRTSFDMGRLLVSRSDLTTTEETRLAIAPVFELWSLCEDAAREAARLGRNPLAAPIVRGPEVSRRRRTSAGA